MQKICKLGLSLYLNCSLIFAEIFSDAITDFPAKLVKPINFYNYDDVSLPKSDKYFRLVENLLHPISEKYHPHVGRDTSSLWNCCGALPLRHFAGNQWWRSEITAFF